MHSNRRCITRTIIGVQGRCIQCHQYFVLCGGNTKTRMGVDRKKEKSSWRCTVAQRLQVPLSLEMRWWYQHATSGSDGSSVAIDSTIGQGEKQGKTENEQKEYDVRSRQGRCVTGRVAHATTFAADHMRTTQQPALNREAGASGGSGGSKKENTGAKRKSDALVSRNHPTN